MLHALLIDDEPLGVNALRYLLESHTELITVVAEATNALDGVQLINRYRPDLVFLDIQMPFLSGFDVLNQVSFLDFHLIFTTAHSEYALRALKLNALDYLLKPIDEDDLSAALARVKKAEEKKFNAAGLLSLFTQKLTPTLPKIILPTRDAVGYVSSDELVYLEAKSNQCIVFLKNDTQLLVNRTLKQYEEQLCNQEQQFIRLHHSYIVNMTFATRYNREQGGVLVMSNGKVIPVSKQKKDALFQLLKIN